MMTIGTAGQVPGATVGYRARARRWEVKALDIGRLGYQYASSSISAPGTP